ncbi:MAG: phosphoribosylpyrophosphate synthetase [Acidimicrobiia bacterium]
MTDAPETVTEALALLAADGYTEDFNLVGTSASCPRCAATHELDHAAIERLYRFEGPSDPADEAIVLGLDCPACGGRGVLVSAFGPDADPEVLARLAGPRADRPD